MRSKANCYGASRLAAATSGASGGATANTIPPATSHAQPSTEDELIAAFEQAPSQLAPPPSPEVLEAALDQLSNPHALEAKLAQAITARDAVVDEINALIRSAANTDFNPDAFEADHARLEATTSTASTQSSPSKNNYTNSRPNARPSPRSTNTAVRTPQLATRPKPGEPSLTMPPSTLTEQSLSRSTTDESVVRLHPLAPGVYDLWLPYLRSQSALTPIIMYAIQVYRRYPPHNWNQ